MTLPVILGIAVGGILFVVLLTYFVFGDHPAEVGDETALAARLAHEYPGYVMSELLIAADRLMALALEETTGHFLLFYSHGVHVNVRKFTAAGLLSCRVLQEDGQGKIELRLDAFDRSLYVLALGDDPDLLDQAHTWEERLRAAKESDKTTT